MPFHRHSISEIRNKDVCVIKKIEANLDTLLTLVDDNSLLDEIKKLKDIVSNLIPIGKSNVLDYDQDLLKYINDLLIRGAKNKLELKDYFEEIRTFNFMVSRRKTKEY